ncbi:RNA polymerase sigma factor [Litoribacter populi]|uniref:RNA polymerase sigma factor n=1 Tax=Litoribacter populi TaxID=2598460 RepID=UPI00117D4611|nr:sigma-70 family RNA polymerase sigma factor [Litoribacter populi]
MNRHQLEQLVKSVHQEAYIWARQCCGFDGNMARDVLQQAYLKILEGKAEFSEKSKAKTWLFSIIRYTASEEYRQNSRQIPFLDGMDLPEPEAVHQAEDHEELLQYLPERQREVLLLIFYHDMTLEKAASVMGLHIGTVRTHYDRGKKNLKKLIEKKKAHEDAR